MKLRRTIFGALAGAALLALAVPQGSVAQISDDYTLSIVPRIYQPQTNRGIPIPYTAFQDQAAPGNTNPDPDDGVAGPFNIFANGEVFEYNGDPYTQFYVCVNGWISFENAGTAFITNDPYSLFNNQRPNLTIAPFFGDHYYRDPLDPGSQDAGGSFKDTKSRDYTPSTIRRVYGGNATTGQTLIVEWEDLNINYEFDPSRPDDPFAPVDSVIAQASSVGSFQAWLFEAPPGSVSRAGDIEFHYGAVGPRVPFPDSVGSIVKTSGASVGVESAPAVSGGQTTYLNAVAYRESGGRLDSAEQSRRLTRIWPPTGFPSQVFLFSATRLRRISDWGDGDADLTQLDNNLPTIIRDDQRRFVTFLDVIRILRHQATRNVPFDFSVGRHGFHGDVDHNGRFYYSTRNYNNTGDSLNSQGNLVRYPVKYPIKSTNFLTPQPADNSFSGFLFDADVDDAATIMLYLAAKIPVLPWLPDTNAPFGKLPSRVANDVQLSKGRFVASNRIEIPVTFNGSLNGALGVGMETAEGTRIIEVRPMAKTEDAWVEAVASENRLALAAAGNFQPNDVIATLVVEASEAGEIVFNGVKVGAQEKGMRKLNLNAATTGEAAGLSISQNAPNPFAPNTVTSIGYTLPVDGKVNIRVFDILGREIKSLENATMKSGSYIAEWNGLDATGNPVESGIYYCRIDAAGQSQTIAMQVRK